MYFNFTIFNSIPGIMPIERINSKELLVVTYEWKNEMLRFYVLGENSGTLDCVLCARQFTSLCPYNLDNSPGKFVHRYKSYEEGTVIIHSLQIKVKLRANKKIAQYHISSKYQNWDSNPGLQNSKTHVFNLNYKIPKLQTAHLYPSFYITLRLLYSLK